MPRRFPEDWLPELPRRAAPAPRESDHQFARRIEWCRCEHPLPGTRYLGETPCVRCQRPIRRAAS